MKSIFKNNIKFFLGFLIGGIMFGGIGIYAATLSFASGDVDHTKSDGTNITVKAALDELYSMSSNETYKEKTITWTTNSYTYTPPAGEKVVGIKSLTLGQGGAGGWAVNPTFTINANGSISFSNGLSMGDSYPKWSVTLYYK